MIGLALRPLPQVQHELSYADIDGDFVLLGLVGMLDPPREEVIRAIADCHSAGIRVKMITGDHAATAASIARSLGLNSDAPLTGVELDTSAMPSWTLAWPLPRCLPAPIRATSCAWLNACRPSANGWQ